MNYGQSDNTFDGILYADGACTYDVGGWAFVLVECATGRELQDAGAVPDTTNNRMELLAIIKGLERLKKPCHLEIVSDSQYCLKGMESWRLNWKQQEWKHKTKQDGVKQFCEVKNLDLWKRLDELLEPHQIEYSWVKGHAGHLMNEKCDRLATDECANLQKLLKNKKQPKVKGVSADTPPLKGGTRQMPFRKGCPGCFNPPPPLTEGEENYRIRELYSNQTAALKQLVNAVSEQTARIMSRVQKNKIVREFLNIDVIELSNIVKQLQRRLNVPFWSTDCPDKAGFYLCKANHVIKVTELTAEMVNDNFDQLQLEMYLDNDVRIKRNNLLWHYIEIPTG